MELKNLGTRTITGIALSVLAATLLLLPAIFDGGIWGIFILLSLAIGVAALEFIQICSKGYELKVLSVGYGLVLFTPLLVLLAFGSNLAHTADQISFSGLNTMVAGAFYGGFLVAGGYLFLAPRISIDSVSREARELFIALILFLFGGGAMMLLPFTDGGPATIAWLLLVVACNDIAAYLAGQRYGTVKVAPTVSPGKTIVGSLAGLVVGIVVAAFFSWLLPASVSLSSASLIGIAVVLAAQVGDLAKSYLKRLHGVKDSGSLLPGHGGVLDRIDGYLGAAPVVMIWLAYDQGGYLL